MEIEQSGKTIKDQQNKKEQEGVFNWRLLSNNLHREIISFLELDQIPYLQIINKDFLKLINNDNTWKVIQRNQKINFVNIIPPKYNKCMFFKNLCEYFPIFFQEKQIQQKLQEQQNQEIMEKQMNIQKLVLKGVQASSTDYSQSIDKTQDQNPENFWSSTGTQNPQDREEFLLYQFGKNDFAMVTFVEMQFYYAHYLASKIYMSNKIKIQIGTSETEFQFEKIFDLPLLEPILEEAKKIFPIPEANTNLQHEIKQQKLRQQAFVEEKITFKLKIPQIIFAKYLKISFIGKQATQDGDELYYIAVQSVKAKGYPIILCKNEDKNQKIQEIIGDLKQVQLKKRQSSYNLASETLISRSKLILKAYQDFVNSQKKTQKNTNGNLEEEEEEEKEDILDLNKFSSYDEEQQIQLNQFKAEILNNEQNVKNMKLFFKKYPTACQNTKIFQFIGKNENLYKEYFISCVQNTHFMSDLETFLKFSRQYDFSIYESLKDLGNCVKDDQKKLNVMFDKQISKQIFEIMRNQGDIQKIKDQLDVSMHYSHYQFSILTFELWLEVLFRDYLGFSEDQLKQEKITESIELAWREVWGNKDESEIEMPQYYVKNFIAKSLSFMIFYSMTQDK